MQSSSVVLLLVVLVAVCVSVGGFPRPQGGSNAAVVCRLPAHRGNCRALLPRWRYDPAIGGCQEFKFGGCDGNGNNFNTEQECMAVCAGV